MEDKCIALINEIEAMDENSDSDFKIFQLLRKLVTRIQRLELAPQLSIEDKQNLMMHRKY